MSGVLKASAMLMDHRGPLVEDDVTTVMYRRMALSGNTNFAEFGER